MPAVQRWIGTGRSSAPDARVAGRGAAAEALANGDDAALHVVVASDAYDAADLLAGVREAGGARSVLAVG